MEIHPTEIERNGQKDETKLRMDLIQHINKYGKFRTLKFLFSVEQEIYNEEILRTYKEEERIEDSEGIPDENKFQSD